MKTGTEPKPENDANKAPDEEGPRSFVRFLATLSDGELESEASYQVHELCKRLQEAASAQHAKVKGKVKLVINMVADVNNTVGISYAIETVAPKRPTTPAVFWMTKGGNLSASDTRQLELRPREVPGPRQPPRDAPAPAPVREV